LCNFSLLFFGLVNFSLSCLCLLLSIKDILLSLGKLFFLLSSKERSLGFFLGLCLVVFKFIKTSLLLNCLLIFLNLPGSSSISLSHELFSFGFKLFNMDNCESLSFSNLVSDILHLIIVVLFIPLKLLLGESFSFFMESQFFSFSLRNKSLEL